VQALLAKGHTSEQIGAVIDVREISAIYDRWQGILAALALPPGVKPIVGFSTGALVTNPDGAQRSRGFEQAINHVLDQDITAIIATTSTIALMARKEVRRRRLHSHQQGLTSPLDPVIVALDDVAELGDPNDHEDPDVIPRLQYAPADLIARAIAILRNPSGPTLLERGEIVGTVRWSPAPHDATQHAANA